MRTIDYDYLAQQNIINRDVVDRSAVNLTQDFVDSLESEVKQQPGRVIYELEEASRRRVSMALDRVLREYGVPQEYRHKDKVKRLVMELLSET